MTNNKYLYNLLLSHRLLNLTNDQSCLGPEISLAYYLFKYSKSLFIHYPRKFDSPSLIIDTHRSLNIFFYVLSNSPSVSFLRYIDNNTISFKYDNYTFNLTHDQDNIYKHNELVNNSYNDINIKMIPIEGTIAYCFQDYAKDYNIDSLLDACVLISTYHSLISNNILFSNLLQIRLNVSKVMKKAKQHIKLLNFSDLIGYDIKPEIYTSSIYSTIGFCYGV